VAKVVEDEDLVKGHDWRRPGEIPIPDQSRPGQSILGIVAVIKTDALSAV